MFSGKIILNFGVQESLRTFLNPIFTGGAVEENGSCRAAFCESAALRGKVFLQTFSGLNSLSQSLTALTAPSGREPLAWRESLLLRLKL